jgi:hypothetical protein
LDSKLQNRAICISGLPAFAFFFEMLTSSRVSWMREEMKKKEDIPGFGTKKKKKKGDV